MVSLLLRAGDGDVRRRLLLWHTVGRAQRWQMQASVLMVPGRGEATAWRWHAGGKRVFIV